MIKLKLTTAEAVVDALGGVLAVAEMTGTKRSGVYNWLAAGRFPADTYLLLRDELKARNMSAPNYLWPMRQPIAPKKNRSVRA
jgi:hypothetical protein